MSSNANNNNNGDVSPSPSPRSASTSLQAAAALNLGLQRGEPVRSKKLRPPPPFGILSYVTQRTDPASSSSSLSQRALQSSTTGRRRSQVLMNLQIADPSIPAPGEMVDPPAHGVASFRSSSPQPLSQSPRMMPSTDPRHSRAPSLGELHQELENEQEFQVNRLLQEIRRLQVQVQRQQSGQSSEEAILDRSGPIPIQTSSLSGSAPASAYPHYSSSVPRSPVFPRSSFDMARADLHRRSRTPSRGASPRLRATSISGESGDQFALGGRDESSFYQAETQMLMRENQMLRHRIRELGTFVLDESLHCVWTGES